MKHFLTTLVFLLIALSSQAQEPESRPFNGIVESAEGQPVKGARVWVVNDKWYSKTDKKGRFGLTNVNANDTLHVKYKQQTYTIPVSGRKAIRVIISDASTVTANEDSELADTGYGFVKRREICIPTSGISGEILVRTGCTNVLNALQGLVPGLTVTGGHALIRGVNSLNLSTDPLYIIDNVEVPSLDTVSVYDVDHVEVIKDGSMYGAKGANGVIAVTTKRGPK